MEQWPTYSRKQWVKAVNYSALLGYLAVVGVPSVLAANPGGILGGAILGVPIAMLCCWVFAAPALKYLMRKEIGWLSAASWGAFLASIMALVSIAIGRYIGWQQSDNPNFSGRVGGDGYIREIDGILTPYGWLVLAQNTLIFIVAGALIAILVKWLIGEPASQHGHHN